MKNRIWVLMYKGKPATYFDRVIAATTRKKLTCLKGFEGLTRPPYKGYSVKKVEF